MVCEEFSGRLNICLMYEHNSKRFAAKCREAQTPVATQSSHHPRVIEKLQKALTGGPQELSNLSLSITQYILKVSLSFSSVLSVF